MQYHIKRLAQGVHVFGPHAIPFWLGNFAALSDHFVTIADAIEDRSSQELENAQRLIAQISMDRAEFDAISDKDKPAWLVNMFVVELSPKGTGLLVYSPLPLDEDGVLKSALNELGPVKVVVAPSSAHTLGLASFRAAYPDALFLCPRGGGFLGDDLMTQRPELRFHAALEGYDAFNRDGELETMLSHDFEVEVTQDNARFEIILYHRPSQSVLTADTIYKSDAKGAGPGPGGPDRVYLSPTWFASAYQALTMDISPYPALPDYRVERARHPKFDASGFADSLRRVLSWEIEWLLCCHTDPLSRLKAKQAVRDSWGWILDGTS